MNNIELLATIRQEISRMLKDNSPYFDVQERTGAHIALAKLSSFLDSLSVVGISTTSGTCKKD